MRFFKLLTLSFVIATVLFSTVCHWAVADSKVVDSVSILEISSNSKNHDVSNIKSILYLGKIIDKEGKESYAYTAVIDSAPVTIDGMQIDCSWKLDGDKYVSGLNVFSATVSGTNTIVNANSETSTWNPVVYIGGKEYTAKSQYATLIPVDPTNSNYRNNVLEWDYGVCKRQLRIIEGLLQEQWIFDKDPNGDVWICSNVIESGNFEYDIEPFAYDADGNSIPINQYKQVSAKDMASAVYPVVIDPTDTFVTSSSDGEIYASNAVYATAQSAATGTITDGTAYFYIGQIKPTSYTIERGYVFFDTSALPDTATVTAANVSLYGYFDQSTADFNLSVTNGMPTYPHDPLAVGDFNKVNYTGIGGGLSTASFITTGYNNISLDATGMGWISKTGTTKFCLRSLEDINASAPVSNERVAVWAYEKGAGFRPYLLVTYETATPPTVSSVAASKLSITTGRMNGYLDDDGGEESNEWFEYFIDQYEIKNGNFETGAPPANWSVVGTGAVFNQTAVTSAFGTYSANLSRNGNDCYAYQDIGNYSKFSNSNLSFGMWVNASVVNTSRISICDNASISYSAYHSGGGDWELLTTMINTSVDISILRVGCNVSTTNTTSFFDFAMLADGAVVPINVSAGSGTTGDNFYYDLTGLRANTSYGFRAIANNSKGADYGDWLYFTTFASAAEPNSVLAIPSSDSIELIFDRDSETVYTYVRFKIGSYPTDITDGSLLTTTDLGGYTHTSLSPGTSYFYSCWGFDGVGSYSINSTGTFATTWASVTGDTYDPEAPEGGSWWTSEPNSSAMEGLPFYETVTDIGDTMQIPHDYWWMMLMGGLVLVGGLYIYSRSYNLFLAVIFVSIIGIFLGVKGILPTWTILAFVASCLGACWREVSR